MFEIKINFVKHDTISVDFLIFFFDDYFGGRPMWKNTKIKTTTDDLICLECLRRVCFLVSVSTLFACLAHIKITFSPSSQRPHPTDGLSFAPESYPG